MFKTKTTITTIPTMEKGMDTVTGPCNGSQLQLPEDKRMDPFWHGTPFSLQSLIRQIIISVSATSTHCDQLGKSRLCYTRQTNINT